MPEFIGKTTLDLRPLAKINLEIENKVMYRCVQDTELWINAGNIFSFYFVLCFPCETFPDLIYYSQFTVEQI